MIKKYDLSVIIAARCEEFLSRTVEGVLNARKGNTEIIVILDGALAVPPVADHEDVTIIYHSKSVGQRQAINEAAKLSKAKFIMKLDAHCIMDEGFDVKLMADCEYNWTVVPRLYNLHGFNWKCKKCGNKWYQGPTPKHCCSDSQGKKKNKKCDSKDFVRKMVWKPRWHKRSDHMRFDPDLKFKYWGSLEKRPEGQGDVADTMSLLGACFFMHRKYYWELGGSDEKHGSWGQQGTEMACKTWLSGGRLVVNKKTWYSHLFRTQGGDFGHPYPQSGNQIDNARKYSNDLWKNNKWPLAKHPLSWLIEKFWPVPGWKQKDLDKLKKQEGMMTMNKAFDEVMKPTEHEFDTKIKLLRNAYPTKGIIYYTDNKLSLKIAHKCKRQIKKIGLPIVSASLKPMKGMGKNIHIKMKRGYEAYFTQILAALKASDADIIFFCEHDWLYHPTHFDFTPPKKDVFYYNDNWWRLRAADGHAISYDTHLLPGIVAYRSILIDHYELALAKLKSGDSPHKIGFEPGTHNRPQKPTGYKAEGFKSEFPNIDIRHDNNLTASRWSKDQFRSQQNCRNWQETDGPIPGWGIIKF